ncbi:MAG: hypothetical protein ABIH66_01290 [bacterium]
MKNRLGIFLCFALIVLSTPCFGQDEWWKEHPAKKVESYNFSPDVPLEDRVVAVPGHVMDFMLIFDKDYIAEDAPYRAYTPTESELEEVKAAIRRLPKEMKEKISPYLLGIYFIENLLGSGFAEFVPDEEGKDHYFMLFNPKVLKMDASEWITDKERSCFIEEPGYELEIDIGEGLSGFYYIFSHEISHVYDYIAKVTPGEGKLESEKDRENYPFIGGVWDEFGKPKDKYTFNGMGDITFYGMNDGPKIKISEAPALYDRLQQSPFVTLYGAVNWMEDFAEYMAAHMNIRLYERPWKLTVSKDGEVIYEMKDILKRENIKSRVAFVEKLLE